MSRRLLPLGPILVAAFDPSARKTDLTRMILEMRRALGEQHVDLIAAGHQRNENGGKRYARTFRQHDHVRIVEAGRNGRAREPCRDGIFRQARTPERAPRFQIVFHHAITARSRK